MQVYWPWLTQLGRYAAKFSDIECGDLNEFLTKHVIPANRDGALADRIARAFTLKQHRPELEQCRQLIDLKTLVPEAVRNDPDRRRTLKDTDVDEFVERLKRLADHRCLDPNDRTDGVLKALSEAVPKLQKLVQNPAIKSRDPLIEKDLADFAAELRRIQLLLPTMGNRREVPALEQRMGVINKRIEQPKDWLSRIRVETAGRTGTSPAMKERCQAVSRHHRP